MFNDVIGLGDWLGIDSANILGASMGGTIAQIVAADHPDRTQSVGVVLSSTNQPFLPPPTPAAAAAFAFVGRLPKTGAREQVIDRLVAAAQVLGGTRYAEPESILRDAAAAFYDRAHYPERLIRPFAADTASGSPVCHARRITAPTTVIHGSADPILRPRNGRAVAEAIAGASLHIIEGMGHHLRRRSCQGLQSCCSTITSG